MSLKIMIEGNKSGIEVSGPMTFQELAQDGQRILWLLEKKMDMAQEEMEPENQDVLPSMKLIALLIWRNTLNNIIKRNEKRMSRKAIKASQKIVKDLLITSSTEWEDEDDASDQ